MTLMEKEIFEQPSAIENCLKYNVENLKALTEKIQKNMPVAIFIAARGTSDHAGIYAKYIFEKYLGIPTGLAAASIVTSYNAKINMKNCLVIGISQSGMAADVVEYMKNADESGAITVSITNNTESTLAKVADFHLFCNAGVEKSVAATKTFTTEMALLLQIAANLSNNEELKTAVNNLSNVTEQTLKLKSETDKLADSLKDMQECFVLSRGITLAAAFEAALKIQETCYVRARGYSISDFHHGPFAMVSDKMPVFIFACDKSTNDNAKEMIEKSIAADGNVIVFSNNEKYLIGSYNIKLPEICEGVLAPFGIVVAAQMFACSLSLNKGNNPDAPRGLKKVTITK